MSKKNVVVEVVCDEDGMVSVEKVDLGEWKYVWCVWGDENEVCGSVENVVVDYEEYDEEKLWKLYEKELSVKFDEYVKENDDSGFVDEEVDWVSIKEKMLLLVKEEIGNGMDIGFVKVGGYSIECDNEFVVIVGRMKG